MLDVLMHISSSSSSLSRYSLPGIGFEIYNTTQFAQVGFLLASYGSSMLPPAPPPSAPVQLSTTSEPSLPPPLRPTSSVVRRMFLTIPTCIFVTSDSWGFNSGFWPVDFTNIAVKSLNDFLDNDEVCPARADRAETFNGTELGLCLSHPAGIQGLWFNVTFSVDKNTSQSIVYNCMQL